MANPKDRRVVRIYVGHCGADESPDTRVGNGFNVRRDGDKVYVWAEDGLTVKQAFDLASQIIACAIAAASADEAPRNLNMYDVLL